MNDDEQKMNRFNTIYNNRHNDDINYAMKNILEWNEFADDDERTDINSSINPFATINMMIKEWDEEYLMEWDKNNKKDEEVVNALYKILNQEWNTGEARGQDYLEENKIDYPTIKAIENMYVEIEKESGDSKGKYIDDTLEKKLDIIFYKHAERSFIKIIKSNELNMDYWG
tara:strand:+ start:289 stop:801 length:513 start_codon:yes stop_codon:yes gene_type:complete